MNKIKQEKRAGRPCLVIQSQKGQQLCAREAYAAGNGQLRCLVHLETEKKGKEYRLSYDLSGLISLRDFLLNPMDRRAFSTLLNSILVSLRELTDSYYNTQLLLLRQEYVMVNPASQEVFFILVPLMPFEAELTLRDFLLEIIQRGRFVSGEDGEYIREYIQILNSGMNFSMFQLEEYARRLLGNGTSGKQKRCSKCGNILPRGTNFCPVCGTRLSCREWAAEGLYQPPTAVQAPAQSEPEPVSPDPSFMQVMPEFAAMQPIPVSDALAFAGPYLVNSRTGERVQLQKELFMIGKTPETADYVIRNPAVSRCHACIAMAQGRCFVQDMNSTNHTYLGGQELPPQQYFELFDGVTLRFANEEYIFHMQ